MLWLDRIHRWTGGFLGVLLALMGLTGTLLLYEDAWLRATIPHASEPLKGDAANAAAVERFMAASSPRPNGIIFPSDDLSVFKLTYEKGRGAYADQTGAIVETWSSKWQRPELWIFDFHHHLWMGDLGTTLTGVLGLIGLGFVVTGFILWWRQRKSFALRAWPARMTRLQIVRHHRDLGVVMAPVLIAQFLTGAMLTMRPIADFLFSPWSPAGTITQSLAPPKVKGGALDPIFDWGRVLTIAREQFPDGAIRTVNIGRRPGELIRVRVRQPAESLPNGRTILFFDPADGRLVEARDALALPAATRAYNLIYPIHVSNIGGTVYKVMVTAAGLALVLLGSLAVYSFWGYQTRRRAESAQSARAWDAGIKARAD